MDETNNAPTTERASRRVLGMPVYSIREGQNLGNIKGLIVDAKNHSILALQA